MTPMQVSVTLETLCWRRGTVAFESLLSEINLASAEPPGANPLVAERAPWRCSQSRAPIGNPYRFLSFLLQTWQPLCDPQESLVGKALSATIKPHNPRTTATKAIMNIASAIMGVVYISLFS